MSEPDSLASPPPKIVPVILISSIIKPVLLSIAFNPIFTLVVPYTTDVLHPPYTLPPITAPAILTKELLSSEVAEPIEPWFPPPNTLLTI